MAKKLNLDPILMQIWVQNFFSWILPLMLDILASYHFMQFQEKLMKETSENGKKT